MGTARDALNVRATMAKDHRASRIHLTPCVSGGASVPLCRLDKTNFALRPCSAKASMPFAEAGETSREDRSHTVRFTRAMYYPFLPTVRL